MTAGPFQTEAEVMDAIDIRSWFDQPSAPRNELALLEACALAGVKLGDYDRRILTWLAGFEPQTVAVVVGIIMRATGEAAS